MTGSLLGELYWCSNSRLKEAVFVSEPTILVRDLMKMR